MKDKTSSDIEETNEQQGDLPLRGKTVAVTGANGFVGSNLVLAYSRKDCFVKPLVRENSHRSLLPAAPSPVEIDYSSSKSIAAALQNTDILIHNAAITRGKRWSDFEKHNIELTDKLIREVNNSKTVEQLIFISSQAAAGTCSAAKGKHPDGFARIETDECRPVSYYGRSKLLAEKLVETECRKNWTIIRPCSVYGEGDRDFLQYFKLVERGLSVLVGLRQRYISLIYVGQLCDIIIGVTLNPKAYGEVFFASDGNCYSWSDLIRNLEEAVGRKTVRIKIPSLLVLPFACGGEVIKMLTGKVPLINWQKSKEIRACHWVCDSSKVSSLAVQKSQSTTLMENLKHTYQWYKDKKWL